MAPASRKPPTDGALARATPPRMTPHRVRHRNRAQRRTAHRMATARALPAGTRPLPWTARRGGAAAVQAVADLTRAGATAQPRAAAAVGPRAAALVRAAAARAAAAPA